MALSSRNIVFDALSTKYREKVDAIKYAHTLQRMQLELSLETAPRDSRYSQTLLDLMKREEEQAQQLHRTATQGSVNNNNISKKINELLRTETRDFFAKNVQRNIRKWIALKEKQQNENESLVQEIEIALVVNEQQQQQICACEIGATAVSISALDAEAERLEIDYHQNWYQYELHHLQEAFKSQQQRIDTDWAVHETRLQSDYSSRMERLAPAGSRMSSSATTTVAAAGEQDSPSRWQHPEKQKTLIHTAPVLSPSGSHSRTRAAAAAAAGAIHRQQDGAANRLELERLEKEFAAALIVMQQQKADAKQWLGRQQIRLQAQAAEVQWEQGAIADALQADVSTAAALKRRLAHNNSSSSSSNSAVAAAANRRIR